MPTISLSDLPKNVSNLSPIEDQPSSDNTTTFLIGFGVLLIFMIIGVAASAFLCLTLKKDPYLWEVVFDPNSQGHTVDENGKNEESTSKLMEKNCMDDIVENTQL